MLRAAHSPARQSWTGIACEAAGNLLSSSEVNFRKDGDIVMSTSQHTSSVAALSEQELRRLLLKLRWSGLDKEAAEIAERLRHASADRIVIDPVDTD